MVDGKAANQIIRGCPLCAASFLTYQDDVNLYCPMCTYGIAAHLSESVDCRKHLCSHLAPAHKLPEAVLESEAKEITIMADKAPEPPSPAPINEPLEPNPPMNIKVPFGLIMNGLKHTRPGTLSLPSE